MKLVLYVALLMHLLYDFHWQGDFIAQNKGNYKFLLVVHALTWAMLIGVVLWFFGTSYLALKIGFLFVTHLLIDNWKSRIPKTPENFKYIYYDQAGHVISLVVVCTI